MDLKNFLPNKEKKTDNKNYWSLIIEPNWVQAGIWEVVDSHAHVVSYGVTSAWNQESELVAAADAALSSAVQSLDDGSSEPEKTVFGVVASWVEDGQIKKDRLEYIKHVCSELSLKPAGFVVLPEAVAHLCKSEEGVPLTGIVIGLAKETVEVSIFNEGNLKGSVEVARSISVVEDVVEGLTRFAGSALPPRFLLYNCKGDELEEVRQSLLEANWEDFENIKFLHTPKVEIINPERKIDAVSLAGAVDIANVTALVKETVFEDNLSGDNFEINNQDSDENLSVQELGFALEQDVNEDIGSKPQALKEEVEVEPKLKDAILPDDMQKESKKGRRMRITVPSFLAKILKREQKNFPNKNISTGKKIIIIGLALFVVLAVSLFCLWWYYPSATVSIYLSTTQLSEKIDVRIDPNATNADFNSALLPGRIYSVEVSGDKTTQATGIKTVGDKAKGEVMLYRVGTQISLSAGDQIKGSNDLVFTIDSPVNVASGSASTPGTASVSVTAAQIGSEYNLAQGASFVVENYSLSDIEAKNDKDFSGGSSREINAVSENDLKKLDDELEAELKEKALGELRNKVSRDTECSECVIVEESYIPKVLDSEYSAKVGDEADTIQLTLEKEAQVLAVNEADLLSFAEILLKDRIPEGFVLRKDQLDVDFSFKEEDDGVYVLSANIKVNLFPQVDSDEIARKIVGKYPQLAENYFINEIPGFVRAEIVLKPKLRGRLRTLPHVEERIEIDVGAEK
ncbi:hypothetical protein IPM62_06425 [Candidatus Woesebacteria bacterium]|nr:MAG: hypothetical protein IPM62_06425 [Candidatus Woesebacteria bacterium]